MKKILLLFLILFSTPVFALVTQDISNSCGNIIFAHAVFTPNVINLNWYMNADATTPMTVPTASQQCTYDTQIILPPDPVRPGYTFGGWRLRQ